MKANYSTLRKRIHNGDTLTLKDFRLMGELFEVDPAEVLRLVLTDLNSAAIKLSQGRSKRK